MVVMELHPDYEENIRNQLIKEECPAMLLLIFNFVFFTNDTALDAEFR